MLAAAGFAAALPARVLAQAPATPPATRPAGKPAAAPQPLMEARALDLLRASSARLAASKSMAFTATVGYEYPSRLGPPLLYTVRYEVLMQRPNRLRVLIPGDVVTYTDSDARIDARIALVRAVRWVADLVEVELLLYRQPGRDPRR